MIEQQRIRHTLHRAYLRKRARNRNYSVRSFARFLEVNPSAVSEILNGKRRVSTAVASRILKKLNLTLQEKQDFLIEAQRRKPTFFERSLGEDSFYRILKADQFRVVSDWYHYAILSLAEIRGFRGESRWLAHRLGIGSEQAEAALLRLERMGMLVRDSLGRLKPSGNYFMSPDEVPDCAIREAHREGLDLARNSLEQDSLSERDFISMTLAIDPKKLDGAKKLIRKFRDGMSRYLTQGDKQSVYRFCVQLFPLVKPSKEEESSAKD